MPKRNYGHEKRQKELNRQRKKAEKLQRRHDRSSARAAEAEVADTPAPESPPEEAGR